MICDGSVTHNADPEAALESIGTYPPLGGRKPGPPPADNWADQKAWRSVSTAATTRSPSAELVSRLPSGGCGSAALGSPVPNPETARTGTDGSDTSIRSAAIGVPPTAPTGAARRAP